MKNPIIQLLNAVNSQSQNNTISRLRELFKSGNVNDYYNNMVNTNPQFKRFVEQNKDKTIEEIAMEYDIDLSILKYFM